MFTGKIALKPRFAWILMPLLALLAVLLAQALHARASTYPREDLVHQKPIQAVHGLPAGAHSPAVAWKASDQPRLELSPAYYDFGRVSSGRVVTHTFLLRNRGDADLLIRRAYTTCDCTAAKVGASVIPPGKAALVTVEYDPRVHASPGSTVRRGVILETNDPLHPQAELWVQAEIR